jgi:nicotinamidase-related amidase
MRTSSGRRSATALLLIDFINDLDYPGGSRLAPAALRAARNAARLMVRARRAKVPVIYVNDNFRLWRSDFREVVAQCEGASPEAAALVAAIRPEEGDYFVLKPRNSGFFQTPLAVLLEDLGVKRVVLAGLTTDNCVLFTANDAHLRGLGIVVAADCVASIRPADHASALKHMASVDKAAVRRSRAVRWRA